MSHDASANTSSRERIALSRAYAVITPDQIVVKPARSALVGPAIQAILAILVSLAIATWIATLPVWLLMIMLLFVMIAGPTAVMGLAYNVMGSAFLMERKKGTCRWQQGFLGLGLGTRELVPFPRIDHIAVGGDFEDELNSGDLQDLVRWEVRLVKDNGRVLEIASITTARPLADEALERANDLATALGRMCEKPVRAGTIPEWALEDYESDDTDDLDADETIEGDER
ncbi:MAG: hypothetical protein AB7F65_11690 [Dehalococcoidia bacterium]